MKVFLAGENTMGEQSVQSAALAKVMRRRLYSYYYHGFRRGNRVSEQVLFCKKAGMELFLDSGAYSAYTRKEKIDLDKYAEFIHAYSDLFSYVANLDDIGDTGPRSWENLKELERQGCPVFPVFHFQDDIAYLKRMLDEGYPFLALGGLVGAGRQKQQPWLDHVWAKYLTDKTGKPRVRVHGFGLTDFFLMARYPWFSIDSSSWVLAGSFGSCLFLDNGVLYKVFFSEDSPNKYDSKSWHYDCLTQEQKARVDTWLKRHNVTADECRSHYSFRHLVNAATYQQFGECGADRFILSQETLF